MPYCVLQDIIDVISEEIVVQLTDDDNQAAVDEDKLDKAIARADEMIDAHLRNRYTVPFATVPELIRNISTDLAIYYLYDRRLNTQIPESIEKRYEKALAILASLQSGDLVLDSTDAGGRKPSEYRSNKTADDRIFNDDVLEQF